MTVTAQSPAEQISEGFITCEGEGCPVDDSAVVDIVRRDREMEHGCAGFWNHERRHFNSWRHNGGNCDIVRYRPAVARSADVEHHARVTFATPARTATERM